MGVAGYNTFIYLAMQATTIINTVLAVVFLNEQLRMYHYQGACLIFFGIMLTTFRVRQR